MPTLSFGFKTISNGARGFWNDLNSNFTQTNNHTHDGVNSSKIAPTAITKATQQVLAASWSATSGGLYTQTVTLPSGYTFSSGLSIKFYIFSGGNITDELAITPVRLSNTTYQLEVNDNTLTLTAVYA